MSFSLDRAAPIGAPRLDYGALVAAIRSESRHAKADPSPEHDSVEIVPSAPSTNRYLAAILLGRPDWRTAALALGGCFAPGLRSRAARPAAGRA